MTARRELRFSRLIEAERFEILGHGREVADHAARVGQALGLSGGTRTRLRLAGLLHDIGKIEIPEGILGRPGPLDPTEWTEVRRHPAVGARMLRAEGLAEIADWVHCHHERPDGRGYPEGLRGPEIPLEARILAVADAYDAMISERPYSRALEPAAARDELRRGAGSQFDTLVVEAFFSSSEADQSASTSRSRVGHLYAIT